MKMAESEGRGSCSQAMRLGSSAEVLGNACAIRRDEEIHGIKISGTDCKLSQYADDTTMILDGSELSFSRTPYLLDIFADISELKVNYEKTKALWIGSLKNSNTIIPSNKQITRVERKVYALGVWFSTSDLKDIEANFFEKTEKIKNAKQLVS